MKKEKQLIKCLNDINKYFWKLNQNNYKDEYERDMAFSGNWKRLENVLKEHDGYDGKIPEGVKPWEYK
jgi:hypothetical protein|tara:strand:- start:86 stop:289 length:204 start_codon:yes stop_codon:yes gene_type:complete